jgi:hypothetical protein
MAGLVGQNAEARVAAKFVVPPTAPKTPVPGGSPRWRREKSTAGFCGADLP